MGGRCLAVPERVEPVVGGAVPNWLVPKFLLSLRFVHRSALVGCFISGVLLVLPGRGVASAAAAGRPIEAAKAEKPVIVVINMGPVKYNPPVISVPSGKLVILRFVNKSTIDHEALIGDAKAQDAHEKEMQAMAGMEMHHDNLPGYVEVKPGKSKDIAWTFPKAGVTFIGCHKPAHYKGGMKLRVLVKSSTGIA
jgi:uncharacterized cupredoxin-like copper-binding protein